MPGPVWKEIPKVHTRSFATVASVGPLPRAKPESVGMSTQKLARIGETLHADIANNRIPGAVVAIARKGKLVYFEAFGYADRATDTPVTTDAVFNIASMTKAMAAAGALMLVERGHRSCRRTNVGVSAGVRHEAGRRPGLRQDRHRRGGADRASDPLRTSCITVGLGLRPSRPDFADAAQMRWIRPKTYRTT